MISKAQRKKIEDKIYKVYDILDKSGINTNYYKEKFSNMSDDEFYNLMKQDFPFRFHSVPFKVEPSMSDIMDALDYIGVPLLESITLPYKYINKDGIPVSTKPCIVVYMHLKKVQQFGSHKNSIAPDINSRDMKTGLLTYGDKGGRESDRENEAILTMGLYQTSKELNTIRADAMDAKTQAYNDINTLGYLTMDDIDIKQSDSLSKNLLNTYILSAMGISNLISPTYQTKYTLEKKQLKD